MKSRIDGVPRRPRLDEYDFRARYVPAVIVTLPALVAVFALFPMARSIYGFLIGPAFEAVFVLLLVRIARDEGKKIEPQLIQRWGGMPTTRYLRHRDPELEPATRERYKLTLGRLTGLKFPTAAEEAVDPADADGVYASAVSALREHRRGKAFPLVFTELCNYGMMRNLLGLKRTGLIVGGLSIVSSGGALLVPSTSPALAIFAVLTSILVAATLLGFVTPTTVGRNADAYARALLRTCEPKVRR
jgi:hypothetical protein